MSNLRVTSLRGRTAGSSPTLPDGVVVTGVTTSTSFSGNLTGNASGLTGTPNISCGTGAFSGNVTLQANLDLQDNDKILLGTDDDLQIFHSGTQSFLDHSGTGSLYLRNYADDKNILLQTDDGSGGVATYVSCNGNTGEVRLFHYGTQKLNTKATGITVTGDANISGKLDVGGELGLLGTTDSHKYIDCRLGSNALYIRGTSGGDTNHENMATFNRNGSVNLYYDNAVKFETASGGINVTGRTTTDTLTVDGNATQVLLHAPGNHETVILRNDGGKLHFLLSAAGTSASGTWNALRPLSIDTDSGYLESQNGQALSGILTKTGQYRQVAETVSALNIDLSTGNYFKKSISTSSTVTFSNPPASGTVGSFTLELVLTGSSTAITWPDGSGGQGTVYWNGDAGTTAPTLVDARTHLFMFVTTDGGTKYRGAVLSDYTG